MTMFDRRVDFQRNEVVEDEAVVVRRRAALIDMSPTRRSPLGKTAGMAAKRTEVTHLNGAINDFLIMLRASIVQASRSPIGRLRCTIKTTQWEKSVAGDSTQRDHRNRCTALAIGLTAPFTKRTSKEPIDIRRTVSHAVMLMKPAR